VDTNTDNSDFQTSESIPNQHARQVRELQQRVYLNEKKKMKDIIDQHVAVALSKQSSEKAPAASGL
jgi:hypothetical protein